MATTDTAHGLVFKLSAETTSEALQFMLRFFTLLDFRITDACTARTPADTTDATAASASSVSETVLTKTPPSPHQNHPIFHELLTEMANQGGGVIESGKLKTALTKRDKAAQAGSSILAFSEVDDDTIPAMTSCPGFQLISCLRKCTHTECFDSHWKLLLNAPETLRHPSTWLAAASKALSYTNDSLSAAMTKVIGSSKYFPRRFQQLALDLMPPSDD